LIHIGAAAIALGSGRGAGIFLGVSMVRHLVVAACLIATAGHAQEVQPAPLTAAGNRAGENAVRQAGDAFGTVIGREEIGI